MVHLLLVLHSGTEYTLTADLANTVIVARDATFDWTINGDSIGTTNPLEHDFLSQGSYTIYLAVTPTGASTLTNSTRVTVGEADIPDLTATKTGTNPLEWTLTAELNNTGIDDTWTRTWDFGDGSTVVTGVNTANHTFPLTATIIPHEILTIIFRI